MKDPGHRAWLPRLEQLPNTTTPALRYHIMENVESTDRRAPSLVRGVSTLNLTRDVGVIWRCRSELACRVNRERTVATSAGSQEWLNDLDRTLAGAYMSVLSGSFRLCLLACTLSHCSRLCAHVPKRYAILGIVGIFFPSYGSSERSPDRR